MHAGKILGGAFGVVLAFVASASDTSAQSSGVVGPTRVFPRAALGFRFRATVAQARAACTESGHAWEERSEPGDAHAFWCSGPAADVGYSDAAVSVWFCGGRLCALTLWVDGDGVPGASWAARHDLAGALVSRYGPAAEGDEWTHAETILTWSLRGGTISCAVFFERGPLTITYRTAEAATDQRPL